MMHCPRVRGFVPVDRILLSVPITGRVPQSTAAHIFTSRIHRRIPRVCQPGVLNAPRSLIKWSRQWALH
jgi:hypothetical protein